MYHLIKKLKDLKPYEPISGSFKIRLDANESFLKFDNSMIIESIKNLSINRYPDPYSKDVTENFSKLYNLNPSFVTAGNGSDELIGIICGSFLEKGDKILCFDPDFSMYRFYSHIYELDVNIMNKDENLLIDLNLVSEFIRDNDIKCVMFSNPCNPTSLGIKGDRVRDFVKNTNALVVLDEAYMDFWDKAESLLDEVQNYSNLIILKTCSKAFAMAGIRLGFTVANNILTDAIKAAKSPYNVNSLTQAIGSSILSDKKSITENIEIIKKSVSELYLGLKNGNFNFFDTIYEPRTNFIFIKSPQAENIFKYLLSKNIAVRQLGNYLRITCGTEEENQALLDALIKKRNLFYD